MPINTLTSEINTSADTNAAMKSATAPDTLGNAACLFDQSPDLSHFVTELDDSIWQERGVKLKVLRLDQLHPQVSGNKWLKLKGTLQHAQEQGFDQIVSFGGPYSNHLHALAWAGAKLGLKTHGVVRGRPEFLTNPTLSDVVQWGMSISFVSYQRYREKTEPAYLERLQQVWGERTLIVPEGGAGPHALKGFVELFNHRSVSGETHMAIAAGTGGSLAGLLAGVASQTQLIAVPVIKGASRLLGDVRQMLVTSALHNDQQQQALARLQREAATLLDHHGHYGGYGKVTPELMDFIEAFEAQHKIPLEPVYTGKLFKRLYELLEAGEFQRGDCVLAVHTGGLQGNRGFGRA